MRPPDTSALLGPAPHFSSSHTHTHTPPLGAAFLGPSWGVATLGCRHFPHSSPRSGAFSTLALKCHCQPQLGTEREEGSRREGRGHSQLITEAAK